MQRSIIDLIGLPTRHLQTSWFGRPCRSRLTTAVFTGLLILLTTLCGAAGPSPAFAQVDAPASSNEEPAQPANTSTPQPASQPQPQPLISGYEADVRQQLQRLPLELARLQKAAQRLREDPDGLAKVRNETDALIANARSVTGQLTPLLPELQVQIDRLGPPPKDGEAPEPDHIVDERKRLNQLYGEIGGAIKSMRLTETRANQLVSRLQQVRHGLLARDLLSRSRSVLEPEFWSLLAQRGPVIVRQLVSVFGAWLRLLMDNAILFVGVMFVAGLGYVLSLQARQLFVRRTLAHENALAGDERLGFFHRTRLAAVLAPAFAGPRVVAALLLGGGIYVTALHNGLIAPILVAVFWAVLIYVLIASLSRAVLLPQNPALRLVGLPDASANRMCILFGLLALIYGLHLVVTTTIDALYLPPVFGIATGVFSNVLFAALLIAVIQTPIPAANGDGERILNRAFGWLRVPVVMTGLIIVVMSLLGYVAFGRFIASQVMLLGAGGIALFLVHRGIMALTREEPSLEASAAPAGIVAEAAVTGLSFQGLLQRTKLSRTVRFILNAIVAIGALAALLISWGFSSADIAGWLRTAIVGFEVGEVRISPAQILVALMLFVGLIAVTRLVQRWLNTNVLTAKQMDAGLANSIDTGVGYAGTALALLAGVSYAGLDITNLAIVAGALSVGIGFGLQSIVNNFVSGLILLVERPIKVGDWIVVGGNEGYVRRISVRATEIETFDRASLILPNSELITGTVQNWTHRNAMGRVVVTVGASYDSDPGHVLELLTKAASECNKLLRYPAPFISFDGFGNSSLDFTVRAYVSDVNTSLTAKSELRTLIFKSFQDAGIEIPFPQHDLHLRDLDGVRAMMKRAAEARADAISPLSDTSQQSGNDFADGVPPHQGGSAS